MLLTFLITLILGIDKGIIAGVAISLVVLIRTTAKPKVRCVDSTKRRGREGLSSTASTSRQLRSSKSG